MLMLLKWWREAIIVQLIVFILIVVWNCSLVKKDLITEKAERKAAENSLEMLSKMLESNRVEYDKKIAEAEAKKEKVRTEYKTRTEIIYQWRENNESDCNSSMQFVNDYHF